MQEQEILKKWKQGLSKEKLSKIYQREYNQEIKKIRRSIRHKFDGKFISNYEALAKVEKIIYQYLKSKEQIQKNKIC